MTKFVIHRGGEHSALIEADHFDLTAAGDLVFFDEPVLERTVPKMALAAGTWLTVGKARPDDVAKLVQDAKDVN